MKTLNTFSLLFLVNPQKATDNHVVIYARITVNQKRSTISLKKKIPLDSWSPDKKRVKGNSAEAKQTNQYLDQVHSKLFQCYQDLKFSGKLVTAKLIKAHYLGEDENSKTLLDLLMYHKKKIECTLARGTIRNFGITEGYINKFLNKEKKTTDIYLRELDYKFLCDLKTIFRIIGQKRTTGR